MSLPAAVACLAAGIFLGRWWPAGEEVLTGQLLEMLFPAAGPALLMAAALLHGGVRKAGPAHIATGLLLLAYGWLVIQVPWGGAPVPAELEAPVGITGEIVRPPAGYRRGVVYRVRPLHVMPQWPSRWHGLIDLYARGAKEQRFSVGDIIRGRMELSTPAGPMNPGEPDRRWTLAAEGVLWLGFAPDEELHLIRKRQSWWNPLYLLQDLRLRLEDVLDRLLLPRNAGLAKGLLFGTLADLDEHLTGDMRVLGLTHVLSVSGLHVGLLAGLLVAMAGMTGLSPGIRASLLALWLGIYIVLAGGRPPVWRAGLMLMAVLAADRIYRPMAGLQKFCLALLLLIFWRPSLLFDLGFQLSFLAYAGLAFLAPPLIAGMEQHAWLRRMPLFVRTLTSATLAAQITTLPILISSFGSIPVWSPLANLLVIPLVGLAVGGSLAAAVAGVFWLAPAWWVIRPAEGALNIISWLAGQLARLPFPEYETAVLPLPLFLLYYGLLTVGWRKGASGFLPKERSVRWRVMRPFLIAALSLVLLATPLQNFVNGLRSAGRLHVEFIAVGQGDGMLLTLPDGSVIVIDGGPPDPGGYTTPMERILRQRGVRRIRLMVATHGHADHYGGLISLVRNMHVDEVWHSGFPAEEAGDELFQQWMDALSEERIPVYEPKRGYRRLIAGVWLEVLNPPVKPYSGTSSDINNNSVVIRVVFGENRLLLTGDIGERAETDLLRRQADLRADLLKVAHHGSASSSTGDFLDAVRPEIAVVQVDTNPYGLPAAEALARIRARGIPVWRTDERGAVIYRTDGRVRRLRSWKDGGMMEWSAGGMKAD